MNEIFIATWESFEEHVRELRSNSGQKLLFRGQGDALWPLTTTLERAGQERMPFTAYYQTISRICAEIETLTGKNWKLPLFPTMNERLRKFEGLEGSLPKAVYRYMLYLRHHGFPSPFLDWTRSPYVAAYFAFRDRPKSADTSSSIYVFSEMPRGFKMTGSQKAKIVRLGPYIRSHRRHFLQQCEYSICVFFDDLWRFVPHQEVFGIGDPNQDILTKITIPCTERVKVLKLLDDHNLNAYSLFASEESLMETMALRGITFQ